MLKMGLNGTQAVGARWGREQGRFAAWPILWAVMIAFCGTPAADAATLLDRLLGAWSGSGRIRYDDGRTERVRCNAYYNGSGERLRLAIRCRSDSAEVEIRGLLTRRGEELAGTWEERTFNASGRPAAGWLAIA